MMLRRLFVLLLLANAALAAWQAGWLDGLIGQPVSLRDREPQRLEAQVAPEALQILTPAALARRTPPPTCLEAGPLSSAELPQAEAALRQLMPEGGWSQITRERPGSWMVYMGRYTSKATMERRADELRKREVAFEEVRDLPEYEPGFLFGRYASEADANAARQRLLAQKVRFARVVRLEPPSTSHLLRIPRADAELQQKAVALGELVRGKPLHACGR
ncbi:hypothetical protein [Leptothrix discophora]|uniref:SPOR domain-containing protein n=1 Tax=Leptothrix discophora TaxID=89 RepID=A0ABT9G3X4_LEPDI|nr:hypothetical protein [Leptothrix discophora]MDP4301174.1 hypothetical protein [Leptothrix discophora]